MAIPTVVTVHDLSFTRRPELFGLRDRMLLGGLVPGSVRRARRVIAVSEFTRGDLIDRYGLDPAHVVAIRERRVAALPPRSRGGGGRAQRGSRSSARSCSSSARCSRARTRRRCSRRSRACEVTTTSSWCSPGATAAGSPRCASASAISRLGARVRLLGHVAGGGRCPGSTPPPSCSRSRRCTRGSGFLRSRRWRAARPVCASATTGLGEAVGDAGLTFDPRSPEEIAECMRRLLEDDDAARDAARERARARSALHLASERGGDRGRLPRGDRMTVPDVVATASCRTGQRDLLAPCLAALRRRRRTGRRAREHPRRQRGAGGLARRPRERVDSSPRASRGTRTRSSPRRARATC